MRMKQQIFVFDIGGRKVGVDEKCLIVAEVAQAHDGSLGMAHAVYGRYCGASVIGSNCIHDILKEHGRNL